MAEFAVGADGATMGAHDVLGDGEAKAGASGFAGAGFIDAVEALEEARQVLRGNAGSEVTHIKLDALRTAGGGGPHSTGAKFDTRAGASVLHSVVDQVGKDLVDGFAVGQNQGQRLDGATPVVRLHNLEVHAVAAGNFAETLFGIV